LRALRRIALRLSGPDRRPSRHAAARPHGGRKADMKAHFHRAGGRENARPFLWLRGGALIATLLLAWCSEQPSDAWLAYAEGEQALIAAPEGGWLTGMTLQRGDTVKLGDRLFTLDAAREAAGRDQAAAQLLQARAALTQERAALALARTQLARQDRLAADGVGVPALRDEARAALAQSQARIAQLEGQIAQMQAAAGAADYALSQRVVVAQTEGVVQDILFRQGEYV